MYISYYCWKIQTWKKKYFFFYISVWAIMFNTLTWDLLCQMTTKYHSVYNVHWRKISICGLDKGNFASIIGATIHWVMGSIERSCDGNRIVFFFIFTVSFHYKKNFPSYHFISRERNFCHDEFCASFSLPYLLERIRDRKFQYSDRIVSYSSAKDLHSCNRYQILHL